MVEKRTFDSQLIKFAEDLPSIKYIMLLDKEGIPISFVARSMKEKFNSDSIGGLFHSLFLNSYNFRSSYQLSYPLLAVTMNSDSIFIEINIQNGILGLLIDKSKWPLPAKKIENFLSLIIDMLPELSKERKSYLNDLYPQEEHGAGPETIQSNELISEISLCLQKIGEGQFNPIDYSLQTNNAQELVAAIGQKTSELSINTSIVLQQGQILFENEDSKKKLNKNLLLGLDAQLRDFQAQKLSVPLISCYFYKNGELIISSALGSINQKRIELGVHLPDWKNGLNSNMAIIYNAVYAARNDLNSDEAQNVQTLLLYLMSDISSLREQIDKYISLQDNLHARELMERSALLLENQQEYSVAGDYLKWIAYTFFEETKYESAIEYYIQAANSYRLANDLENLASNLTDIASLFETIDQYPKAMLYYQKAKECYEQLGAADQTDPISQKIEEIKAGLNGKLLEYINSFVPEKADFKKIAQNTNIPIEIVPELIQDLINSQQIPGFIDHFNQTYAKHRTATTQNNASSISNIPSNTLPVSRGGSYQPVNYEKAYDETNKLKSQNIKLDTELNQMEQSFRMKGINLMDILKYQARLEKKKANELKIRIYSEMPQFNANDGSPLICGICLADLDQQDVIVTGPNGHGYHSKCVNQWVKTQDRCPVCNEKLFPFILRDYRDGNVVSSSSSIGNSDATQQEINNLKSQITLLQQSLGGDMDLFDKLIAERENKSRLLSDLKKKDQIINELKSHLNVLKKKI